MRRKKICCIVFALSVFAGAVFTVNAYLNQASAAAPSFTFNDVYKYPVYPGDAQWAEYDARELTQMLQLPEELLNELTTEELVKVVVDYPYLSDMFYYNSFRAGFNAVSSSFNGLQELLRRRDAGTCLVEYYKNIDFAQKADSKDAASVVRFANYDAVEVILAQDEVLSTIPQNVREEFEKKLGENMEYCRKNAMSSSKCGIFYEVLKENEK